MVLLHVAKRFGTSVFLDRWIPPGRFWGRLLVGWLFFACSGQALLADPPGSQWVPLLELTDEFDGDQLDSTKWHNHNPIWEGRKPSYFSKDNVAVHDGQLRLTARVEDLDNLPEGYHTFTTAAVKSKAEVKYGYFEIKCQPMKSKTASAFWFYRQTDEEWTEIDVFEICGLGEKEKTYHMNAHVFHSPKIKEHMYQQGRWTAPYHLADEFHVYALRWDKRAIRWFVDGKMVHKIRNVHWHQSMHLNFDSETMPEWFGLPEKESLPTTFRIEYVRSWKKK